MSCELSEINQNEKIFISISSFANASSIVILKSGQLVYLFSSIKFIFNVSPTSTGIFYVQVYIIHKKKKKYNNKKPLKLLNSGLLYYAFVLPNCID